MLVLDDDDVTREVVTTLIRELGHEVDAYASGQEALRAHARSPYAVILVDWVMPEMDGIEVLRRVRALSKEVQPVRPYLLMMTARDRPENVDEALEAGADDYLTKPIDAFAFYTRLRVAVRAYWDRSQRRRAESDRRRSEDRLERYQRDLRELIDKSPSGMVLVDGRGVVTFANVACRELPAPIEVGQSLLDLISGEQRERVLRLLDRSSPTNGGVEVRVEGRDPRVLELQAGGWLEGSAGDVRVLLVQDLTHRLQLAERLQVADRLSSLGALAAGVAHEVNNPLGFLAANLDYLAGALEERSGLLPRDERREMLDAIDEARQGAARVARIVSDLKRFSSTGGDARTEVDVGAILETAAKMTMNELRHRGRVQMQVEELPAIEANGARLLQVFVNLLTNAAQALDRSEAPGEVGIRAYRAGGELVVDVRDNGPGIAADVRGKIFDPFFTTKPVGEGTGLGLSICHGIVADHGGRIEALEAEGGGTLMRVALPLQRGVPTDPAPPPVSARILVIDDEPLVGRALKRALRTHDVTLVTDAQAALARLREDEFDLVFCDLAMPDMTGMDLYEALQRERPAVCERMVFMTGGAFTSRAREFLERIDNRMIEKPFGVQMVRALVQSELASH